MARSFPKLQDDLNALFQLPLAEFIGARNELAKRLKQSGRANDANFVKALAKPSVSAWTVNQLYWNNSDAFDKLLAAGQRFHKAQTSGKVGDMRDSNDARREALAHLADLATSLLTDAGHNPSLDTIRRVTTTLEAISAYASLSDGPTLGRLTQDVDPPGFESLASFVPGADPKKTTAAKVRRLEEVRQAKITAAKASLEDAKKQLREAEEQFEEAKREFEKASDELASLLSHR